jgi:hypothetical protein
MGIALMRRRRGRQSADKGSAQARVGWLTQAFAWVRTHIILGGIVGAALIAVTGWFGGFFDSLLRSIATTLNILTPALWRGPF